eukprot:TRINITY_DN16520_c0_g1_i2.p1 TRINITY_DN16520_c0_g1~~TRINITY_DN16520_c0_g1_i2.p1  ORF type:complete len:352 (+),score=66.68 TRINITY_DN16520_c0_g1_i2:1602-2657(+)
MTLATSCSLTLSPSKKRQLKINAERLYENKFHARWITDPSARATRNKYRQLLSQTSDRKSEPIMNTLIRGDYYGKEGVSLRKEKIRPFGIVAKNKLLQVQSRLSAADKRQLSKLLSEKAISEDRLRPTNSSLSKTNTADSDRRKCLEHDYWSALDALNRKRRIDFHHRGTAKTRESPVALAMTDSSYMQGIHESNNVVKDICKDFEEGGTPPKEEPQADRDLITIADVDNGRLRKNLRATKTMDAELNSNCAPAAASVAASNKAEVAVQKKPVPSTTPKLGKSDIEQMVSRVHSSHQQDQTPKALKQREIGDYKYHHIGITDHSHKKIWKDQSKYADQRVPILSTEIPQGL